MLSVGRIELDNHDGDVVAAAGSVCFRDQPCAGRLRFRLVLFDDDAPSVPRFAVRTGKHWGPKGRAKILAMQDVPRILMWAEKHEQVPEAAVCKIGLSFYGGLRVNEISGLTMRDVKLYHTPLGPNADAQMDEAFSRLAESRDEDPVLHIEAREIRARRKAGGVVWFGFKALCGGPRSQNDYLEIASQFHTVLLSDVPYMPVRMASEARRFTWLVDVLYDRRVKLIMSAQVAPEALYTDGPLAHEFPRTVSRLNEMQSAGFLAQERRMVNTRLT